MDDVALYMTSVVKAALQLTKLLVIFQFWLLLHFTTVGIVGLLQGSRLRRVHKPSFRNLVVNLSWMVTTLWLMIKILYLEYDR